MYYTKMYNFSAGRLLSEPAVLVLFSGLKPWLPVLVFYGMLYDPEEHFCIFAQH